MVDDDEVCEARSSFSQSSDAGAAAGEVARDAGAVDAAADDEHVDVPWPLPPEALVRSEAGGCIATILASTRMPQETSPWPHARTFLLALDQGTSSSRAIVFDARRRDRRHRRSASSGRSIPQPGWVEHDPREIWATQLAVAREAIARAGARGRRTSPRIGITNQRETTLVWDRATGEPIGNAIVWQDRRTARDVRGAAGAQGLEPLFRERTGLVLDAYFSGTKLAWLLDHVPGARAAAERGELAFGTVDTWLMWMLTGGAAGDARGAVHATDATQRLAHAALRHAAPAPGTTSCCALLDVPRAMLPAVHPSSHVYGRTTADLFGAPIAIGGVAGDQQSALFGQALLPARAGQEHLRHRLLHADEHRRRAVEASTHGLIATSAAQAGGRAAVRARGQRLHRRRRRAVAARRPAAIIRRAARCSSSPRAFPTTAASCSCRPSPASARRTGTRTRAAPSSA